MKVIGHQAITVDLETNFQAQLKQAAQYGVCQATVEKNLTPICDDDRDKVNPGRSVIEAGKSQGISARVVFMI